MADGLGRARGDDLHERGSAIVELAVAIPALLALTGTLIGLIGMGVVHVRLDEAAFAAARLAARGGSEDSVRAQVTSRMPHAEVLILTDQDSVTVTVTQHLLDDLPILGAFDIPVQVSAALPREDA